MTKKHALFALLATGLICGALLGCAPYQASDDGGSSVARPAPPTPTQPRPEPSDVRLTILHTNDVSGYVDPCG
jgi:2',3'-cyclic-nucleotide 2'-phosphodiesterase (5'-nucleotidase family)